MRRSEFSVERGRRPKSRGMRWVITHRPTGRTCVCLSRLEVHAWMLALQPIIDVRMPGTHAARVRAAAYYL